MSVPFSSPSFVGRPPTDAEVERVGEHVTRSRPLGTADWVRRTVAELGLESTLRRRGRPVKAKVGAK